MQQLSVLYLILYKIKSLITKKTATYLCCSYAIGADDTAVVVATAFAISFCSY